MQPIDLSFGDLKNIEGMSAPSFSLLSIFLQVFILVESVFGAPNLLVLAYALLLVLLMDVFELYFSKLLGLSYSVPF
jgi:hypothetical protein